MPRESSTLIVGLAMAQAASAALTDADLRSPFQVLQPDGSWEWRQELASLAENVSLSLTDQGTAVWNGRDVECGYFWSRLLRVLCKQGTSGAARRQPRTDIDARHRWYFCYQLVPEIGAALDAQWQAPTSPLAYAATAFLHPHSGVERSSLCPGATAFFTDHQPLIRVDGPSPATASPPADTVWWQPLPPLDWTTMKAEEAVARLPPSAYPYTVRFQHGRDKGDCLPWSAAVLVYFLYDVVVTVKMLRQEVVFLAERGFVSQAFQNRVRAVLASYGFPDEDPHQLVQDEIRLLSQAAGVGRWSSLTDALGQTEDEAPDGRAFDLSGILVIVACTSLGLRQGWIPSPTAPPTSPAISLLEVSKHQGLQGSVSPLR